MSFSLSNSMSFSCVALVKTIKKMHCDSSVLLCAYKSHPENHLCSMQDFWPKSDLNGMEGGGGDLDLSEKLFPFSIVVVFATSKDARLETSSGIFVS